MLKRYIRILTAIVICAGIVGPFSMATAFAQTPAAQSAPQASGSINGSIKDANSAPVSGATVTVTGPQTETATTDAQGNFSISNLKPGIYAFRSTRAGYNTATETNITVLAGATQTLAVTMSALTFSTLRTIATVRSVGRGTFNTTPAAVNVVSSQTFTDQGQPQVMRILNEQPGIVASYPQSSANAAVPGAITFPNIRGALSFETASLVDGHPVSVGTFGDYVTTFLNAFSLGGVEVVKGPGADAPEVNYAIGGTVNFLTKNPTFAPSGNFTFAYGSHGSVIQNFGVSDTVGRLGFSLDYATNFDPSPVQNYQAWFVPGTGSLGTFTNYNQGTGSGTPIGFNDSTMPIYWNGNTSAPLFSQSVFNNYATLACCFAVNGTYESRAELAKLTYKLSNATRATFTYLGSQTWADQNGNTSSQTPGQFNPGAAYAGGSLSRGQNVLVTNIHPGGGVDQEINNEPILQGDIRTTLGNDTILARYYHASIERLIHQGTASPWLPTSMVVNVQGTNGNPGATSSGANLTGTQTLTFFDFFNQEEIDKLSGYSLQYNHPFGDNDLFTFAVDSTDSTTVSDSASPFFATQTVPVASRVYNENTVGISYSISLPKGAEQLFNTYQAKFNIMATPKLNILLNNYLNTYRSTYQTACRNVQLAPPPGFTPQNGVTNPNSPFQCGLVDGTGFTFGTTTTSHYDPRIDLTFRPSRDVAVRLAMGSSIAPPYLNLLRTTNQYGKGGPGAGTYNTLTANAGALKPETAFGYDLGADYRFHDGVTTFSGDIYLTNLFNHFLTRTYLATNNCTDPACLLPGQPLYITTNVNLANTRYEGLELQLRRNPASGLGFVAATSLMRGYPYNLPPFFYCATTPGPGCTLNTNLAILPTINFTGGYLSGSRGGLSNQNLPYLQAYGQLSWRFTNGIYAQVNDTILGKNNSLNVPSVSLLNASIRVPFNNGLALELSGDNLTNQYTGLFPIQGIGVPIPLANGMLGATEQKNIGPATLRVFLIKNFGEGANPTP